MNFLCLQLNLSNDSLFKKTLRVESKYYLFNLKCYRQIYTVKINLDVWCIKSGSNKLSNTTLTDFLISNTTNYYKCS